jgi:small conductance mechanosensitive channel
VAEETLTTPETVSQSGIAAATEETIAKLTEGDYTVVIDYATTHLGPALLYAAIGLGIIFVGYLVAKYMSRIISRPVCRRIDETLGKFMGKMVFYCVMFGVTGSVLSKLGAPLGGLAAMLAAAGFAIGLAFQGTLANFAAGVLMLVFRPFKVGDLINAGGVMGKVNEIDLFTTVLDTPDNRRIIVPNSSIASGTIENVTYHAHRRIEVLVGVAYRADIKETRDALTAATAAFADSTIQGEGRGSQVILANLGASAVEWKVRVWVAADNYWKMLESVTAEVKQQLDAANISIPFPQLDVHLKRGDVEVEELQERPRIRPVRRDAA